jgi:hypothetical protein
LGEIEITNIESKIKSNFQNPIFKFSNEITESYGFIGQLGFGICFLFVICSLFFEICGLPRWI